MFFEIPNPGNPLGYRYPSFSLKPQSANSLESSKRLPKKEKWKPLNPQKLIIKILNKIGYKPDLAQNGLEVIAMLETNTYDIILMDIQMPEMNGLEATRIIRSNESMQPVIVAMTANAMKEDRDKCLEVGMDDYLSKPLKIESLLEVLSKVESYRVRASEEC